MPDFDFDSRDLHACERLAYAGRIASASDASGQHRIQRHGEGTEFLDYRPYTPGDDVRRIDWTVFARLHHPYVRVLQHETTLYANLLVDVSQSMAAGAPTKAATACRLACMLGYVALGAGDRVSVATFADQLGPITSGLRGQPAVSRLVKALRVAPLGGQTDLLAATRDFARRSRKRGLAIVISDFLGPAGFEEPLRQLLAHRFRVLALQVLSPEDWGAHLKGKLRLRDSETHRTADVTISPRRLAEYQRTLRHRVERLQRFCLQRNQFALYAATTDATSRIVARGLRERGLLR